MIRWCIFYSNNSRFSHEDGDPANAPLYGVIAVVQEDQKPASVWHQSDFYWWRPDMGCWHSGDIHGFLRESAAYGATWVKQGETIHADHYAALMADAVAFKRGWDSE